MAMLGWDKTTALLRRFGIPFADYSPVNSRNILELAEKRGFPLVIKALSPKIVHKTELGFVAVVNSKEELAKTFEGMERALKKRRIKADIVLQDFIKGKEVIIGVKEDRNFGKVMMFGLGGVLVEALKDVSFRILPVSEQEAEEMIKEIKGYKILDGYRGEKANIKKIADIIVKVSKMCEKNSIMELDLNPVIVNEKEAVAADARIIC